MGVDIITGGLGFIGSHLVDALQASNRKVIILDNKTNPVLDIRKPQPIPTDIDTIYHLAALADIVPSIENPVEYYDVNVNGTFMAIETARKYGCKKFIYAASASCYGLGEYKTFNAYGNEVSFLNTTEEAKCDPQYPYALTKYLGEQLVMHWAKVYKIPVISLRLFNVYGTRSRTKSNYGAMFGTFLAQIANNQPITIVGNGEQKRDFVHVSDVVKAFIRAANSYRSGIYNVGSGKPISINQVADLLGAHARFHIPKRPGEPDITCADITKIRNELEWEPKVSVEDGIKELLDNIDYWKDAPVWNDESISEATKRWFECLQ